MEKSNCSVQYWLEVHRLGTLLFNNYRSSDDALLSFIKSIMETPLLSDIECLSSSEDDSVGVVPRPFTSWILQGLLRTSATDQGNDFFVEAQSKLLSIVYENSVSEFAHLIRMYVKALEEVSHVKRSGCHFKFLLHEDYCLRGYDRTLQCFPFEVRSRKDCVKYVTILLQVITSLKHLIFQHCPHLSSTIWTVALNLFNSNVREINCLVLPLLIEMMKSGEVHLNEHVVKQLCKKITLLVDDPIVTSMPSNQDYLIQLLLSLRDHTSVMTLYNDSFIKRLIAAKDKYKNQNFIYDELTFLSSQYEMDSLVNVLDEVGIDVLFGSVVNDIRRHITNSEDYQSRLERSQLSESPESVATIKVSDVSHSWKQIADACNTRCCDQRVKTFKDRLTFFREVITFCGKCLWKLEKDMELFRYRTDLVFFGDGFGRVTEKILTDLKSAAPHDEETMILSVRTLADLFNLPEVKHLSDSHFKRGIDFLIPPLMSDRFQLPGVDNAFLSNGAVIHTLFLRSLQCIPPGVPIDCCCSIFSRCAQRHGVEVNVQAVKSVPFLCLTDKVPPVRLISDILYPTLMSESSALKMTGLNALSDLVCVLAGTGCSIRTEKDELCIKCLDCSCLDRPNGRRGCVPDVEPHIIKLLVEMPLTDASVKHCLIDNLYRLTMHVTGLKSKTILDRLLTMLEDDDEGVRQNFSGCLTSLLFGRDWVVAATKHRERDDSSAFDNKTSRSVDSSTVAALNATLQKLEDLIHLSLNSKSHDHLQASLLDAVTNIACFPVKRVLSKSIRMLLLFLNQPKTAPLPPIFYELAAAHRTTQLVLYNSYRPEISQFLGNLVVKNRLVYNQSLRVSLSEVTTIFKGLSESRFAELSESYIVPILFRWMIRYNELEDMLYEWCEYVDQPLHVVVSNTFENIYTYMLLSETPDVLDTCMSTIERLTELKITDLILYSQKSIINQLLFNYHRSPEKVSAALKKVIGASQAKVNENVIEGLEARFVGYLLFVVSKFVKEINADSEKIHAIHSLTAVIELMGSKEVTPVARKVLATLQTTMGFNFAEHYAIHFNALRVFIETVDVEHLGPLLATIVTLLIPFLDYDEIDVAKIFTYMIVDNEKAVAKFLPNLIFLPKHPKLKVVNRVLNKHIDFKKETLTDRLRRETSLALHETVRVRMEGLHALRKTIETSSSDIQNLINGSDEPDPCIKVLLEGLMQCCSDPDTNISVLAASCLGQLGAIDPGLLPRKPKPKNELPLSVHDPEFAFLALTEITRGFQNARKSVHMDAFAIAIQELLKMYQISPTGENGMWTRFPRQIQGLMMPMLSSRYKVQAPKKSPLPAVIFGSKGGSSHVGWASMWASKLIGFCKDDRAVILFKVCEPSLKYDVKVLLFFLRYILLHAVIRDPSVHPIIIKEIEAVVKWSRNTSESDGMRSKLRPVRLIDYCGYPSMKSIISDAEAQACTVTVFLLLDFLHSWLRIYRDAHFSSGSDQSHKKEFTLVKDFLQKIDSHQIAIANYEIREYSRAIMYLEDVIGQDKEKLCEHLPLLSKAYALYGDLDSVAGASSLQKTAPKMKDVLLSHQVSGQLEEVRIIFERLGKDGVMTPAHMQEMARCYLNLSEPYTAMNCIQSFTTQQPDLLSILSEVMAESLLKLGDFTQLEEFLKDDQTKCHTDWFVQLGRTLLSLHKDDSEGFSKSLLNVRKDVANALRQTSLQFGDYQQGYSYLIKLQILCEIERVSEIISASRDNPSTSSVIDQMFVDWGMRTSIVQSDPSSLEPLLSIRRILLNLMKSKLPSEVESTLNRETGKLWVKSSEIARKAGCFHQSYNFILNAEEYNIPSTFIEKAQLFWDKGDQDQCLFTLTRGIDEYFPDAGEMKGWPAGERLEERKMCAEAKLLYAVYSEETSNCDHNTNITNYQNAFDVCRQLEKSQVFLGQCLDRVVSHMGDNEQEQARVCELKILMVLHFGKSLMHGCEYIYQTVPRMLSIWLDMGENQNTPDKVKAVMKINKLIEQFLDVLPPFVFMTALPQLLSRLGHPNGKVFNILKNILASLVLAFPQQALWAAQSVAKSSVQKRVKRYEELIVHPTLRKHGLCPLIKDFRYLCDELDKLSNMPVSRNVAFLKLSTVMKELPRMVSSSSFSAIILPITRFCSISVPRNIKSSTHEAFPKEAVYITGLEDTVLVLQSMQRPRKITFRGSDGKLYDILCKPVDDLRRDGRLMEFNNIVNMYLHRDPESLARSLHIRTYVVTPLGESGGLLEWIPNLVGLRKVLIRLYKQLGKYVPPHELRLQECQNRDPIEKKRAVFLEKFLPLHPPVFSEWFRMTFPDPSGWYLARQSYTRTTAVMSMVGYILGLGDRHGENILFDCESGDTVHVDFNCLFNKGERFDWKERVPFRLTHNMVTAMGPFGVEGTYRKSCEITLRVLRSQVKTLMSVLTPFAYDPFGSWGKNKEIVQNERDEKIGEAYKELSDIEKRLNGSLRAKQRNSTLYLSVEGLVRSLILEATDIDNLCQMYFGWGAYL